MKKLITYYKSPYWVFLTIMGCIYLVLNRKSQLEWVAYETVLQNTKREKELYSSVTEQLSELFTTETLLTYFLSSLIATSLIVIILSLIAEAFKNSWTFKGSVRTLSLLWIILLLWQILITFVLV